MDHSHTPADGPLLRGIGIVGWDSLEPVILAALSTESPLLLIGPHGSADASKGLHDCRTSPLGHCPGHPE